MAMTAENFVTEIEKMTVLELNSLVKALEEKFGVSAAAMAMPMAAAGAPAGAASVSAWTWFATSKAGSPGIGFHGRPGARVCAGRSRISRVSGWQRERVRRTPSA